MPFSRISAHVQEAKKREVRGSEYEVDAPKKERKRRNVGGGGRNTKEMHKKRKRKKENVGGDGQNMK